MSRYLILLLTFILLSGCASSKGFKADINRSYESGAILLTSLFSESAFMPDIEAVQVEFLEKDRITEESRESAKNFSYNVLEYAGYEVFVEIIFPKDENTDYQKLSEKRFEKVKKLLVKYGIAKNKIFFEGYSVQESGENIAVVEAELWKE